VRTKLLYPIEVPKSSFGKRKVRVFEAKFAFEAGAGIEPAHGGFADRSVSTSPSGQDTHYTILRLKKEKLRRFVPTEL
jgi:hypothetical protein